MRADLKPTCPAAEALAGPPVDGPSIVCRAMEQEKARADEVKHGEYGGELITLTRDPGSVLHFCCGTALPVLDEAPEGSKSHHTACPVWRAEKHRRWERKRHLREAEDYEAPIPGRDPVRVGAEAGNLDDVAPPRRPG